jgi:hypothetical protein
MAVMNLRRGLLGLWVVFSIAWIIAVGFDGYSRQVMLPPVIAIHLPMWGLMRARGECSSRPLAAMDRGVSALVGVLGVALLGGLWWRHLLAVPSAAGSTTRWEKREKGQKPHPCRAVDNADREKKRKAVVQQAGTVAHLTDVVPLPCTH